MQSREYAEFEGSEFVARLNGQIRGHFSGELLEKKYQEIGAVSVWSATLRILSQMPRIGLLILGKE